jgi:hypothetical protein
VPRPESTVHFESCADDREGLRIPLFHDGPLVA